MQVKQLGTAACAKEGSRIPLIPRDKGKRAKKKKIKNVRRTILKRSEEEPSGGLADCQAGNKDLQDNRKIDTGGKLSDEKRYLRPGEVAVTENRWKSDAD